MPERRAKRAPRSRIVVALIVPMVAVAAALAAAGMASGGYCPYRQRHSIGWGRASRVANPP